MALINLLTVKEKLVLWTHPIDNSHVICQQVTHPPTAARTWSKNYLPCMVGHGKREFDFVIVNIFKSLVLLAEVLP